MFSKKAKPVTLSENGLTLSMTETGPCRRALEVSMSPEAYEPIRNAVVRQFQKEATLKGFRKGKAPLDIVEKQYGDSIRQETMQRATQQAFDQATALHKLQPVGPFEISHADFDDAKGLILEAKVDVEPEFELAEYKHIPVERKPVEVTPQDKEASLKQLQNSMAQMVPAKDKEGEKEQSLPELDDEFAKDIGFESLDKLVEQVEVQLKQQKEQAREEAVRAALYNALVERNSFDLPPGLVKQQQERMRQDLRQRLAQSGSDEKKIEEELEKMEDKMRSSAEKQVKLSFIINRIAQAESIDVTEEDLMMQLWTLSQRWQQTPDEVRKILDRDKLWPSLMSSVRQDKTTAFLLQHADISGEPYPEPRQPAADEPEAPEAQEVPVHDHGEEAEDSRPEKE